MSSAEEQDQHEGAAFQRKRRSFNVEFKKQVLAWLDEDGQRTAYQAALQFKGVSQSTIRGWILSRDEIESFQLSKRAKRIPGAGRRPLLEEYEHIIADAVRTERAEKKRVRRSDVMKWAKQVARENEVADFKASAKWLEGFLSRNGLSLRRRTNLTTLSDGVLLDRAFQYLKYLTAKVEQSGNFHQIVLMDETAVYLEDPRSTTIDETGARHVIIKSTGFASMRVTAILAVRADGSKVPPVVIQKKKNGNGELVQVHGVYFMYNDKAWVNQELIKKYLNFIYPPVDVDGQGKLLVWDSCRSHIARSVKEFMIQKGVVQAVIPGGLTSYVQAGDIGIFKSFKDNIGGLINSWKNSDQVSYTSGGNPRPPADSVIANWVKQAWRQVPADVIQKSIKAAGFGLWDEWHISKHDVYGARFKELWRSNLEEEVVEQNADEDAQDPENEIEDDFDDE